MWTIEVKAGGKWIVVAKSDNPNLIRDLRTALQAVKSVHRETYSPEKETKEAN